MPVVTFRPRARRRRSRCRLRGYVVRAPAAVQMALQNAGFVYTERRRYRLFGLVETGFDRLAHGERQVIRELGAVGSSPVPASTRNVTLAVKHRSEEHTSELQSLMRISYAV